MASLILSARDLDFLLFDWLQAEKLTSRPRYAEHSRETFDAVLELSERIATEKFAPHNKRNDTEEPTFDGERVSVNPEVSAALDAFYEADLLAGSMDAEYGGMQLPVVVMRACTAWFQAANPGTAGYPLLSGGTANLLVAHGSREQIDTWVRPLIEGRFTGTMALSEPQAGSSLADITTRAEPRPDGTFRLFGNKMWISGGDHELRENIVHPVLAKIPGGPPGVKGISLFIVPKYLVDAEGNVAERNDVVLAGLNHKMGHRGTTNALLNFGEGVHRPGGEPGAVGYLVGEPHRGLSYMFHMMNGARISVGLGAAALGYTGYLHALDYARTRLQGRPPAAKDGAPVPIIEHADVRRMLLAQKAYAEGALALCLYCARLVDEERTAETTEDRDRATLLLEVLTPIAKAWPSQWCLAANDLAIQVHGGYGYTRDYDVEQIYRDNRLNAIHEGTNGIQGLDLLGRKVVMRDGAALRLLAETIGTTIRRAAGTGGEAAAFGTQLGATLERIVAVTRKLYGAGDLDVTLANSTVYLEAMGHLVVAWIWLEQLLATGNETNDLYDGKRQAARYFFRWELPRTGPQLDLLDSLDTTTLEMRDSWF
jgi:alkylation response protein AidB-like acyl-CoA dehydrogenase